MDTSPILPFYPMQIDFYLFIHMKNEYFTRKMLHTQKWPNQSTEQHHRPANTNTKLKKTEHEHNFNTHAEHVYFYQPAQKVVILDWKIHLCSVYARQFVQLSNIS